MAPGDLNLKKSWNPALMKNQQKVWEKEQEALAERKRIQERKAEIAKEQELAELRELQYKQTGKRVVDRVDWMYDAGGVGDGNKLASNANEDYLLGKKRVDDLIVNPNKKNESKATGFDRVAAGNKGMLSQMEEINRSREDPMARIQEQRMKKLREVAMERKLREDERQRERSPKRSRDHGHHRSHRSHHNHSDKKKYDSDRRHRDFENRHSEGRQGNDRREVDRGSISSKHRYLRDGGRSESRGSAPGSQPVDY